MRKIILVLTFLFIFSFECFATENWSITYSQAEDKYTGPGIGVNTNTWNGIDTSRIYGYGNINGIQGSAVASSNTTDGAGPTYTDIRVAQPIDWSTVDTGPMTASTQIYSHSINDNGPGTYIPFDGSGQTQIYSAGPDKVYQPEVNQGPTGSSAVIYAPAN